MQIIKTPTPVEDAAQAIADKISTQLQTGKTVLWLMSGGSGLKIALQVAQILQHQKLDSLYVSLTDERYGPIGHNNENWQQLLDLGFELPGAKLYRPLIDTDRSTTAKIFEDWLSKAMTKSDYRIGIFGIGADSHTAGIKPASSAAMSQNLVADFEGSDFERITMTFSAIKSLDEIIVQASGNDKLPALQRLQQPNQDLTEFPAAIFQSVKNVSLYTDLRNI